MTISRSGSRPASVFAVLQILASLSTTVNAMRLEPVERRAAQTNAVCSAEYAWADTTTKKSPCQVAAEAIAPCNGGNWRVPALIDPSQFYSAPGVDPTNPASPCVCSWAVYNLLAACSDCQGYPQAVRTWPDWKTLCPPQFLGNTTYYPADFLGVDTKIPYWAATNPTDWTSSQYNAAQAKPIAQEGNPDLGGPESVEPGKKKTPIGPIVGGVIGGLVVLALAGGVAYYLLRRNRVRAKNIAVNSVQDDPSSHHRNPSDHTMISQASMGYTTLSSSPGIPSTTGAPTIRTHATSIHGFSVFGSPQHNPGSLYTTSPSPPPPALTMSGNPEDVVIPFTLQHQRTDSSTSMDRKSPNRMPLYDSPNAPPNRAEDVLLGPVTPERPRVNPPAYSPHDTASPSASGSTPHRVTRPLHTNNSSDADLSYASLNPGSPPAQRGHHVNNSSSSIYTTPNETASLQRSGSAHQTTYTQTVVTTPSAYPRDVKRRPTEDSINPRDIG